jgi:hypothetical protein
LKKLAVSLGTQTDVRAHRIPALFVIRESPCAVAARDFHRATSERPDVVIASAGVSRGTLTSFAEDLPAFSRGGSTPTYSGRVGRHFQPVRGAEARPEQVAGVLVRIASYRGLRGLPGSRGAYVRVEKPAAYRLSRKFADLEHAEERARAFARKAELFVPDCHR